MYKLVRIVVLFHLFLLSAWANVFLHAPKTFVKEEGVMFSIEAIGEQIDFPEIQNIEGFSVQQRGTSRTISNINGKINAKIRKQYFFMPNKSVTIPKFKFIIDGKEYFTNTFRVEKEKIVKTHSSYFDLQMKTSKKEAYLGEQILVTLVFKYRKDMQIVNLNLNEPKFENFWSKPLEKSRKYEKGQFIIQELDYLIFGQKEGEFVLEPISVDISTLDMSRDPFAFFNNRSKSIRVYSNELNLNIKPLPQNVALIGEFDIKASVDKTSIKEGEAVAYKIEVKGEGNLDDIQEFKLKFPNATVYENKPLLKTYLDGDIYKGEYQKSFSILPTQSMTIPSIVLEYFNPKLQKVVQLKTEAFTIDVKRLKKEKAVLQTQTQSSKKIVEKVVIKSSWQDKLLYFVLGLVNAILIVSLYFYVINRRTKRALEQMPLLQRVKRAKDCKVLLKILLPYLGENESIDAIIFKLENATCNLKEVKKELVSVLKNNEIKEI